MTHTRGIEIETGAVGRPKSHTTPAQQEALHLLRTTNIARAQIARRLGLDYKELSKLQHQLGIERPEQVFGLPKHDVPVRQRKPRKPHSTQS